MPFDLIPHSDKSFGCASVHIFDLIKFGSAGWGMKTGLERSRVTVLGLRLCCGGDLNNTVSHFINTHPTPPSLGSLGAYGYRSDWMKFCFSKWAAHSKAMLISDVEIGKVSNANASAAFLQTSMQYWFSAWTGHILWI